MINDWIECPATDMDRGAFRLHPPLPDILPIAMEQILQLYKSVPNFSSSIKGADCGFQIVDEENGSALWMLGMDGLGMGMAKDYPIRHNRRSPPSQLAMLTEGCHQQPAMFDGGGRGREGGGGDLRWKRRRRQMRR
jgi:hypothetical protein